MPTEAEWEFAAGGGAGKPFVSGDDAAELCEHAHSMALAGGAQSAVASLQHLIGGISVTRDKLPAVCREAVPRGTQPVTGSGGRYKPNANGLYHVAGNVWEWVDGCFQNGGPGGTTVGTCERVMRGGSWQSSIENLRIDSRRAAPAEFSSRTVGFRLVRSNGPE